MIKPWTRARGDRPDSGGGEAPAPVRQANGSWEARREAIERFIADPDAPFLVSFPRTGSHWLRMLMELYFAQPSLVRVFYHPERTDYLTYHTHDLDLACERRRVLYLYRDPVDTVFSQIMYEQQSPRDEAAARQWAGRYAEHLAKWLIDERFTTQKTVIRYEELRDDLPGAFEAITDFFGRPLDADRLAWAAERVTHAAVKDKTAHDPQVVQMKADYEAQRAAFRAEYTGLVHEIIAAARPALRAMPGLGGVDDAAPRAMRLPPDRPKLSAVVCACNEARLLPDCLEALSFCDERIVIDLDSSDGTAAAAAAHGARVVHHPAVAVVEQVRRFAAEQAKHDWIVFMDPDMVFPAHRGEELRRAIAADPALGMVWGHYRNLCLGRPLRHGRWGGLHRYPFALHRRRVELDGHVHAAMKLGAGWRQALLSAGEREGDLLRHRWVESIRYMFAKHRRYARREGEPRYARGERFTWRSAIRTVGREIKKALVWRAGWRDGAVGVGLALFWGWYTWACLRAVRRVQQSPPRPEPRERRQAA